MWSLSNAFTSAFKQLEPIPQFGPRPNSPASWQRYDATVPLGRIVATPGALEGPSPGRPEAHMR